MSTDGDVPFLRRPVRPIDRKNGVQSEAREQSRIQRLWLRVKSSGTENEAADMALCGTESGYQRGGNYEGGRDAQRGSDLNLE